MAAEPHYIDVDLKKSTHYKTTTVTQNDTDVVFILRVSDDGRSDESVLDKFSTVTLTSQRRDGQSFYVLGEKIPGTNEVRFSLGTKELELTGKVSASAQLYSVDGRQSSAKFNYNVEGDLTGDYVPTETEATLIEIVLMDGPATIAEAEQVTAQTVEALELLETEKTVAFQELDDVKEDNKLTWKPEVATVALRNSTYPNPQNGDTVRITEEARIDRFNGTEWITTDRYNPNALDLVHQQLADTTVKLADKVEKDAPGVISWAMVKQDVRENITGGNTAVVGKDAVITPTIANKAVTLKKMAIHKESTNKINVAKNTENFYVLSHNGTLAASASFTVSEITEIKAGFTYYIRKVRHIAFYDADGVYISGSNIESGARDHYVFTTPENAYYVRVSWGKSDAVNSPQQLNEGSVQLPFEEYYLYIDKDFVEKRILTADDVENNTLGVEKLNFINVGKNLFDVKAITPNYFVSQTTGLISANDAYDVSDFIAIEGNQFYSFNFSSTTRLAYYDENMVFISGLSPATSPVQSPSNARYVRIAFSKSLTEFQQFEKGQNRTSWEPYGYRFNRELPASGGLNLEFVLPPKMHALTGEEFNIYFDNIINGKDTDYQYDVTCAIGGQYENYFRVTPTAAGTFPISIKAYKDGVEKALVESTIIVKNKSVGDGLNKKGVIIGDSTTANGRVIEKLNENFSGDEMNFETIGTRGEGINKHEGRSGWTARQYVSVGVDEVLPDLINSFWNPNTSKFDFSYWMTNNGFTSIDYVVINLGINDMFTYVTDSTLQERIAETLAQYNEMIASVHNYDSSIKVGIALTIPPNYSQESFGISYANGQTRWRCKRNNFLWVKALISAYKGEETNNVHLVPINANLDTKHNFPYDAITPTAPVNKRNPDITVKQFAGNAGVHPATSGYWQIADVYWYWIKSFEA